MAVRGLIKLESMVFTGNYNLFRCIHLQHKMLHKSSRLLCSRLRYCTSATAVTHTDGVSVKYENGLPVISVPLPSRKEKCQFTLKPISHTLSDFVQYMQDEDKGIDRVSAYNEEGVRLARSTPIDILLQSDFHLLINDNRYLVKHPPTAVPMSHEHVTDLSDVKNTILQLYTSLNIEDHQLERERQLLGQLEDLRIQLEPYELAKQDVAVKAKKRTNVLTWLGLGYMGLQFGFLARLTWWEYSWDIMEPVTYFVGYGTAIAFYAYYVLTKQEYLFPQVQDREFLLAFHKYAKKDSFSINTYNTLKSQIADCEYDLRRLRDPLQLQLPIQHLLAKTSEEKTWDNA